MLSEQTQRSLLEKNALFTAFPVNKAVFDEYARSTVVKSVSEDADGNMTELPKASVFADIRRCKSLPLYPAKDAGYNI
jgi:hypothetical protein